MPILQNKLVIKSIEALHDEAVALVPKTVSYLDVTAPTAVLHTDTPPQESPIIEPKDKSADVLSGTASNQNIMARIDHLLRKLDDDEDVTTAPQLEKSPKLNIEDQTSDAFDSTADGYSDDMIDDGQKVKKPRPNQAQALADIAEAIYQAQHQTVDTVSAGASQNNSTPLDMEALSTTVADEVRRTVSAVMIAELPELVRNAVGEEIRALPVNALGESKPTVDNPSATETVTTRKTAATKKSGVKKVRSKKTVAKKASGKTDQKKVSVRKLKPKKMEKKSTANTTPSTQAASHVNKM
jgi:hypothetical protein